MKRSLVLRQESLTELTPEDLGGVAGGQYTGPNGVSCAVTQCLQLVTTDQVMDRVSREISCGTCYTFLVTGCG